LGELPEEDEQENGSDDHIRGNVREPRSKQTLRMVPQRTKNETISCAEKNTGDAARKALHVK
jgi:hypothetical protein